MVEIRLSIGREQWRKADAAVAAEMNAFLDAVESGTASEVRDRCATSVKVSRESLSALRKTVASKEFALRPVVQGKKYDVAFGGTPKLRLTDCNGTWMVSKILLTDDAENGPGPRPVSGERRPVSFARPASEAIYGETEEIHEVLERGSQVEVAVPVDLPVEVEHQVEGS